MSLYFALYTVENNKNKKSVKFQGDMLNFCDFIQVFVFTRNHHLKYVAIIILESVIDIIWITDVCDMLWYFVMVQRIKIHSDYSRSLM